MCCNLGVMVNKYIILLYQTQSFLYSRPFTWEFLKRQRFKKRARELIIKAKLGKGKNNKFEFKFDLP